jgi:hypothetical protein
MGGCLSQPAAVQPPASVEIVFDRKVEDDYEIGGKLGEGVQVRTAQEERPNPGTIKTRLPTSGNRVPPYPPAPRRL